MDKTIKKDDAVFKALDLKVIRRPICTTDKGQLDLVIRKGETNYFLTLDSVPLDNDMNNELMGVLFPAPKPQEAPKVNKYAEVTKQHEKIADLRDDAIDKAIKDSVLIPKKKIGRPKGSRDGIKDMK